MKSDEAYRFSLSWQMDTEERILAGEFLNRLGNKKSRFVVQLICDYITAHPEAVNPNETLKFIVNSTSLGETLAETVRSMVQSELAGKIVLQQSGEPDTEKNAPDIDADIDSMLGNLDMWDSN